MMNKINHPTDDQSNQLNVDHEDGDPSGKVENNGWRFKIPFVSRIFSKPDPSDELNIIGADEADTEIATDWKEMGKGDRLGLFVLVAIFVIALVGWGVRSLVDKDEESQMKTVASAQSNELDPYEQGKLDADQTLAGIRTCIHGYFKATTIAELLPYVRLPDRAKSLMLDYYSRNPRSFMKLKTIHGIRPLTIEQKPFVYVDVDVVYQHKGKQHTKPYQLLLEQVGDFKFRMDWEGDVFYMPMSWQDYCIKRPLKSLDLRMLVQPDDFYAYTFRDRSRYQCYKLTSHRSGEHLFGYVERGTALAAEMESLWQDGKADGGEIDAQELGGQALDGSSEPEIAGNPPSADLLTSREDLQSMYELKKQLNKKNNNRDERHPMILRLRFLREDASRRCVLIEELVCKHWIYQPKEDSSIFLK